jgi:hypothetical protein
MDRDAKEKAHAAGHKQRMQILTLFAWLISHHPAVFFSPNKPATSNQPAVLFSQNKSAPAISHQPTEQAVCSPARGRGVNTKIW